MRLLVPTLTRQPEYVQLIVTPHSITDSLLTCGNVLVHRCRFTLMVAVRHRCCAMGSLFRK